MFFFPPFVTRRRVFVTRGVDTSGRWTAAAEAPSSPAQALFGCPCDLDPIWGREYQGLIRTVVGAAGVVPPRRCRAEPPELWALGAHVVVARISRARRVFPGGRGKLSPRSDGPPAHLSFFGVSTGPLIGPWSRYSARKTLGAPILTFRRRRSIFPPPDQQVVPSARYAVPFDIIAVHVLAYLTAYFHWKNKYLFIYLFQK